MYQQVTGMNHLPRIALGTVQPHEDPRFVLWGLMDLLDESGLLVQSFSSQSRLESPEADSIITGQRRRHLDSWLMPPSLCAQLFCEGSRCADVRLVDGQFDVATSDDFSLGGSLDVLCGWLDLPRVAVVNVERLGACCMPRMPADVEGIILDRVSDIGQLCRWQTACEAFYGVPILGAMGQNHDLRAAVTELLPDGTPPVELCRELGRSLVAHFRLDKFLELASRREFSPREGARLEDHSAAGPLSIAVAHDEAFYHHFPNILDVFERHGATVNFFSPLCDESLPPGTDVAYLGGGQLHNYVSELAGNVCMKESLRGHVSSGRRVYAENAGLAYICRAIVMPGQQEWPMVGLLPTVACYRSPAAPDHAVEHNISRGSWLFSARQRVKGYLDSSWTIRPDEGGMPRIFASTGDHDLVGDYHVVGSRLHLDFAARPDLAARFFRPYRKRRLYPVSHGR